MYCGNCGQKINQENNKCEYCNNANQKINKKKNLIKNISRIFIMYTLLLFGFGYLSENNWFCILYFICFLLLIPYVANLLYKKFKITKSLKYVIMILFFTIAMLNVPPTIETNDNSINNAITKTTTTASTKTTTKRTTKPKTTKKTYKVNGEEYGNYIKSVMESIIQEESLIQTFTLQEYMPYIKVWLYPSKCIEENEFNSMTERVSEKIFNEFKKNNYKKVKFYQASYEIINVEFKNCGGGIYGNQWSTDEFSQYYMFELKDYKTYEDYLNR